MHGDVNNNEVQGNWIPLVDYSFKTGISLSTLRRHIKANKVLYRLEDGRYLIYDHTLTTSTFDSSSFDSGFSPAQIEAKAYSNKESNDSLVHRINQLETELQRANEEITELKMLLAIYEEHEGNTGKRSC